MDVKTIYRTARKLGSCEKITGQEDLEGFMNLFFTPQGVEFCTKNNFPSMEILTQFRGEQALRNRFYINTPVAAKNLSHIALFGGDTVAELTYDDPTKRHHVIVMHGAKAIIKASGYAVVFVTNCGGEVESYASDKAQIL